MSLMGHSLPRHSADMGINDFCLHSEPKAYFRLSPNLDIRYGNRHGQKSARRRPRHP